MLRPCGSDHIAIRAEGAFDRYVIGRLEARRATLTWRGVLAFVLLMDRPDTRLKSRYLR